MKASFQVYAQLCKSHFNELWKNRQPVGYFHDTGYGILIDLIKGYLQKRALNGLFNWCDIVKHGF